MKAGFVSWRRSLGRWLSGAPSSGGRRRSAPPRDVVFGLRGTFGALAIGVGASVALISIANGVDARITSLVSDPMVRHSGLVDGDLIARILTLLTAAVVAIMLTSVTMNVMVLGEVVMRARRLEIGIRRGDAAPPHRILAEVMATAVFVAVAGVAFGTFGGLLVAALVNAVTPLPASPTPWALLPLPAGAFTTIVAILRPAVETVGMPLRELFASRT